MSRSIEKLLRDLLPEHGAAPLPASLVELASSILAHSKIKAAAVGADQEVARPHACAHIACDRLKTALNLPPIHSRPPIPPRLYKKLYDYVSASVPSSALSTGAAPKTPRKNKDRDRDGGRDGQQTGSGPRSRARALPSRGTPGKDASLAQSRTPNRMAVDQGTPTKTTGRSVRTMVVATHTDAGAGLAPWIQPTIRFLCATTGKSHLAPTILAGLETIVAPGGRPTKDAWVHANLAGLVGAIYLSVVTQVPRLETGADVDRASYKSLRRDIMALLVRARKEVVVRGQGGTEGAEEAAWHGFQPVASTTEFNNVIRETTDRQWFDADWFRNLADVLRAQGRGGPGLDEEAEPGEEGSTVEGAATLVRRADTMLQDQYDYLSNDRLVEYNIWKTEILVRIQEKEAGMVEPMEIDNIDD